MQAERVPIGGERDVDLARRTVLQRRDKVLTQEGRIRPSGDGAYATSVAGVEVSRILVVLFRFGEGSKI